MIPKTRQPVTAGSKPSTFVAKLAEARSRVRRRYHIVAAAALTLGVGIGWALRGLPW